jgi:hypothetical protein
MLAAYLWIARVFVLRTAFICSTDASELPTKAEEDVDVITFALLFFLVQEIELVNAIKFVGWYDRLNWFTYGIKVADTLCEPHTFGRFLSGVQDTNSNLGGHNSKSFKRIYFS